MYHVCVLYIAALISPSLVQSCGYIPDSCYGDLNWAVSTGKTKYPQYYPNFQSVTGTTLSVASQDDMVTYWACTGDPNGNCGGLELPCSRSCYPSTNSGTTDNSGSSSSGQSLTVVTQNLFWWNLFGQRGGANFYNAFKSYGPYDILLFQECDSVTQIKNGLGYDLSTYSPCHAVAMAWSNSRFTEISKGYEDVGEDRDDQYYGTRCLVWARLQDKVSNKIVFAGSHHGPLPVNTGGKTGGYSVAQRINEVITKNLQSGDTVILGGDFNAESYFTTVTTLRDTFGYNLRKSDWVDHIFTKNGLDATPQITVIPKGSTGSDHDGLKLVWSNGLGGSDTGSGTVVNPSPAPASCGYIPTSCSSDLSWAVNSGKYSHSEYYSNFQSVTGVSLSSASQDDMVTYFVCTGQNPRNNCNDLELPCGRSCPAGSFEMAEEYVNSEDGTKDSMKWIFVAVGGAIIMVVLCVVTTVCVRRRKKMGKVVVEQDGVELRSDEQLQGVDDQMIELEESVEMPNEDGDGHVTTIEVTA